LSVICCHGISITPVCFRVKGQRNWLKFKTFSADIVGGKENGQQPST
jgi:hypothetical protein